jgi:hypothetical protein
MILTALALFAPHLYWAITWDFPTLQYAVERTQSTGDLIGHVLSPLWFAADQFVQVLPIILVVLLLTGWRVRPRKMLPAECFQRDFLLAMALGPVAIHLGISALGAVHLPAIYGSQLWMLLGLVLLFCLEIQPVAARWRTAWVAAAVVALGFVAAMLFHNLAGPYFRENASRVGFPGRTLAAHVEALWNRRYDQPLEIVAGEWWLAGNVALYAASRPQVYPSSHPDRLDVSQRYCTWLGDGEFRRRGGVIVWDRAHHPGGPPAELYQRFRIAEIVALPGIPFTAKAGVQHAQLAVAIIPPGGRAPPWPAESR